MWGRIGAFAFKAGFDITRWYIESQRKKPIDFIREAVSGVLAILQWMSDFLTKLFGNEKGAWEFAHPHIVGGAWGLGQLAYNELQAWWKLLNVILPRSLAWLDGHTHQWVDAKYDPQIRRLYDWVNVFVKWDNWAYHLMNDFMLPHIRAWIGFRTWFDTWPQGILFKWHDWLDHPDKFADWATPPLIGPIIEYFASPQHKHSRDNLVEVIVDSTADIPRHVETAVVAFLNSEM